jgi:hypothetical protein
MRETQIEADWLLDSKSGLLRLKQRLLLTDAEIAIVDRGIAALDRLLQHSQWIDRPGLPVAQCQVDDSWRNQRGENV